MRTLSGTLLFAWLGHLMAKEKGLDDSKVPFIDKFKKAMR